MAAEKEKIEINYVHKNAIHCETVRKEQRHQKLQREYKINPFRKLDILTEKPNTYFDTDNIEGKEEVIELYRRAREVPTVKYDAPITEAQSYGWYSEPLVKVDRSDIRLHHPRHKSELTKYMASTWKLKEQTLNQAAVQNPQ